MAEQGNVQMLKAAYAAFVRGDIPGVLKVLDDDVEWNVLGPTEAPYVGRRKGRDQVARFFAEVGEAVEFTLFEPQRYIADGDDVVALGRYAGRIKKTGKPFASDWAMAWTVRGGQVIRFQEYTDTQALGAAFR